MNSRQQTITYFGYGSLVNRATRPAQEHASRARLRGWQRVWSHRVPRFGDLDGCSSLNIREADVIMSTVDRAGTLSGTRAGVRSGGVSPAAIDGVIATIDIADLPLLDAREAGYDRRMVPVSAFDLAEPLDATEIAVYVSSSSHSFPANECHPLLQSYIDCVMAGFLDRFGSEGLLHFLDTTEGWQSPVCNDRHAPRYGRSVKLPAEQLCWFDSLLQEQRRVG